MSDAGIAGEIVRGSMTFGGNSQDVAFLFGCRGADVWLLANTETLAFVQYAMHSNYVKCEARPEPKWPKAKRRKQDADDHDVEPDAAAEVLKDDDEPE